jgi:peptide/nickel transport system substrate-binding protein
VSFAINRQDIARLVYSNHAAPAVGPVPPANHFWFNSNLKAYPFDRNEALRLLSEDGFKFDGTTLRDREGHPVEFSILTNAGRKDRERMAALIQQDLAAVGIKVNLVTLDFPSVIERITRTLDYESCLLGFMNGDLDPNSQMNVWLSSGDTHQWNPGQKTPATAWEAEIDKLMRAQASTIVAKQRKQYFDRVQQIAWEQQPFIYLVNKNALSAVATTLHGADPVVLHPETYWNIERLSFTTEQAKK